MLKILTHFIIDKFYDLKDAMLNFGKNMIYIHKIFLLEYVITLIYIINIFGVSFRHFLDPSLPSMRVLWIRTQQTGGSIELDVEVRI